MQLDAQRPGFWVKIVSNNNSDVRDGEEKSKMDLENLLNGAAQRKEETLYDNISSATTSGSIVADQTVARNIDVHQRVEVVLSEMEMIAKNLADEEQKYAQRHFPDNTVRANKTALNKFCRFYVRHRKLLKSDVVSNDEQEYRLKAQAVPLTHIYSLRDSDWTPFPSDTHNCNDNQFQKLNDTMVKFVVSRSPTGPGKQLFPTSSKSYVCGAQRALHMKWGYDVSFFDRSIFKIGNEDLLIGLDSQTKELQGVRFCMEEP